MFLPLALEWELGQGERGILGFAHLTYPCKEGNERLPEGGIKEGKKSATPSGKNTGNST